MNTALDTTISFTKGLEYTLFIWPKTGFQKVCTIKHHTLQPQIYKPAALKTEIAKIWNATNLWTCPSLKTKLRNIEGDLGDLALYI